MMRNTFKLILFTLVLNLATGIMTVAITDATGNQVFQTQDMARVPTYDANGTATVEGNFQSAVNPAGVTEDKGNLVFRLLDLISLGFIKRILSTLDYYMYGFINFLNALLGHWLNPALYAMLFGGDVSITSTTYIPIAGLLKSLITIGYILAAFELWTNKTIVD